MSTWLSLINVIKLHIRQNPGYDYSLWLLIATVFLSLWHQSVVDRVLSVPGLGHWGHWQTVQTQIRCRSMQHLIRVCTICLNYRKIRAEWNSLVRTVFPAYTLRQSIHQCCQCFGLIYSCYFASVWVITLNKRNIQLNIFISPRKHMLWVLKGCTSVRYFQWVPTRCFWREIWKISIQCLHKWSPFNKSHLPTTVTFQIPQRISLQQSHPYNSHLLTTTSSLTPQKVDIIGRSCCPNFLNEKMQHI